MFQNYEHKVRKKLFKLYQLSMSNCFYKRHNPCFIASTIQDTNTECLSVRILDDSLAVST